MRNFLTTIFVFALLSSAAAKADDWTHDESVAGLQKFEFSRFVPSGVKRMLEFAYLSNPDCSIPGTIEARKIQEPEHGTVEFANVEGFANYKPDTKFAKCNDKKVPGVAINYKSSDGYVGPDNFSVIVMYPNGMAREVRFKMIVR
jgi:hypothetical protein